MKKNIPWWVLILIGVAGIFLGGNFFGLIGIVCLLIGIANAIAVLIKKYRKTEIKEEQIVNKNLPIKQKSGIWMLLIGAFLIFLNISRGGGFTSSNSPEATGYNLTSFIIWIISIVLVIKGIRKIRGKK